MNGITDKEKEKAKMQQEKLLKWIDVVKVVKVEVLKKL